MLSHQLNVHPEKMGDQSIRGIVPPVTTPFGPDGGVDVDALRADLRYLIEVAKVHGIAVCGSTGEGHTLTTEETRLITGIAVEEAAGRVPVITGIIADSTRSVIERGQAVADLGVAALQVTPVHYLFCPDDDAMQRYFAEIVVATGIPVIIYNVVPWAYLSPELLTRIITEVDGVIGVKQSAEDLKALADLLMLLGNQGVIMSAVDALLYPSFMLGAHGAIAAILTAVPELCVQLWDAVQADRYGKALDLHAKLLTIWNAIKGHNLPANVKYAMELQGRPAGQPRAPMPPPSEEQQSRIRRSLTDVI
jgi:4-hydroxy-tetrahydrodipicolinate synthase